MADRPDLFDYRSYGRKIYTIPLDECEAHPLNPRISADEDALSRLVAAIKAKGFLPEHSIMVRRLNGKYQIVSGHRRWEAAKKAGEESVPAWVYENMSDEEAHSLLLLDNEQSELTALEKGKHAYDHIQLVGKGKGGAGQTGGISEYAKDHNYGSHEIVRQWMYAYEVYKTCNNVAGLGHRVLYEISKTPEEAWAALCDYAVKEGWTVKQTQAVAAKVDAIKPDGDYGYDMAAIYGFAAVNRGADASKYKTLFNAIRKGKDGLKEGYTLYRKVKTQETKEENHQIYVFYKAESYKYNARDAFIQRIRALKPLEPTAIEQYLAAIRSHIAAGESIGDSWEPQRTEEEVAHFRLLQQEELWRLQLSFRVRCGPMESLMGHIGEQSVDLILTDPPYGLASTSNIEFLNEDNERQPIAAPKGDWDLSTYYHIWIPHFKRVLRENGSIYIFVPDFQISHLWQQLEGEGFIVRNLITWHKTNPAPCVRKRHYCFAAEYILFATVTEDYTFEWQGQNEMHNVITMQICQGKERTEHPTQKPVELLKYLISISSKQGDLVLDPFAGVGSTAVAAYALERDFIVIEKEQRWCQEARERLTELHMVKEEETIGMVENEV